MASFSERYIVNKKGEQVGVLLDINEYRSILAELEELESIRAFDAAKASKSKAIPFKEAVK
ncbi:hypothetical protein KKG05_06610 [bacterium]|nr:hypothetical protein [bacterium]MBU1937055.1 hypothetical protein [bacterium]